MTEPVLTINGLSKSFGAVVACDQVSLTIRPGEIHALIGPNGAGKSTLIKQISGALRQDTGQILIGDQEVSALNIVDRARAGLARSFQVSSVVPDFTALQNTMLAVQGREGMSFRFLKPVLKNQDLVEKARACLTRVGLAGRAEVPAAKLSHGERRNLEIAMALALNPKVFLLDEPMAGMGAEGSKALTALLAELKSHTPILLVEHDMDAVFTLADRISVLFYGRIITTGTVDEVRRNPDVIEAYLGGDSP